MMTDGSDRGRLDHLPIFGDLETRRTFLKQIAATGAAVAIGPTLLSIRELDAAEPSSTSTNAPANDFIHVNLKINGKEHALDVDPRTTLLDALRERLINGRRVNSCLTLAVMHEGDEITTIEGLANGDKLHPVQSAFIEHDGFQCGYCTPGQICSAVALLKENHANSDDEIREFMSGNICRCGAYPNIVAAIKDAKGKARA